MTLRLLAVLLAFTCHLPNHDVTPLATAAAGRGLQQLHQEGSAVFPQLDQRQSRKLPEALAGYMVWWHLGHL